MAVRKIKSISHASSAKPGELAFTITTADNKAHSFKSDEALLKEFFLKVGAATLQTDKPTEGPVQYRAYFNETLGAVTLDLILADKALTFAFSADTAHAIGSQLVEAAERARILRQQRSQ